MKPVEILPLECAPLEGRLLLREFSHRISNELSSVIGLISLASMRSTNKEVQLALSAVLDRLRSYAQVHRSLQMPEHSTRIEAAAYLRRLCMAIGKAKLDSRGIELLLIERPFQMDAERCWRLGLIISELITNAARHAFRECGGSIRVELRPSRTFVECRVSDDGSNDSSICPGRGLNIVRALAKSLGGTIDQHFGPKGASSVLIIPRNISRQGGPEMTTSNQPLASTARTRSACLNRERLRD